MGDRDQLRGLHPHGGCGRSRRRGVAQLHLLLRVMPGQAWLLMASQRMGQANVRQPAAGRAPAGRG